MDQQEITAQIIPTGNSALFGFTATTLFIKHNETNRKTEIALRQIIAATFVEDTQTLHVSYLILKKKRPPFSLVKIKAEVGDGSANIAGKWAERLMHMVYEGAGIQRARRLKIFINPHGGTRKGVAIFAKTVAPIFEAAGCHMDIEYTRHHGHAYEIAKELPLKFDAIVTVSGDGLIHEVMNGFAHHAQPMEAFSIPIAPIPTGSGNGLSLNLLGLEDGFDVTVAALNVIKGRPMKVDIFSVTQEGKRSVSFMSQAMGLMADLDIGTENLRWMGDTRFWVGLLRGVMQFKPCPIRLSVKIAEKDKLRMAETLRGRRQNDIPSVPLASDGSIGGSLPPLKFLPDDEDGWTTIEEPLLYIYAGKGPYVGRDFMAFPVSVPDDGLIDVVAHEMSSRSNFLTSLGGATTGEVFWQSKTQYFKAHAYRVTPLSTKGALAIDGEAFPFKEFQVEVHQGLATLLSPHGFYAADFVIEKGKT